ncbi:C40 family peptidase [Streptomyces rhizosphaericus]|uniref:C40 family peptidase n=1 Tax=Streptomyces rhizosphaericus TaxID=114699 RepID=UPI001FC9D008|nr:C40 family peptidase [Streptomyces rhizosphaericus]
MALIGAAMVLAVVLTIGMALQAIFADPLSTANAQTCDSPLQPVGGGTDGTGPEGPQVRFEGKTQKSSTKRVTVPLAPEGFQRRPRWNSTQERNAAVITNVARTRRLSPRAAVIAVATAMQESSLKNQRGGDRDSAGLFQQRPSQGWGTLAQVTDAIYASNAFYGRLIKITDWQTQPLTRVAQKVQRSGTPRAYAKWESSAGSLVARTWGAETVTSITDGCETGAQDPASTFRVKNPRTPAQAIRAARNAPNVALPVHTCNTEGRWQGTWRRCCDNFVAQAYGWGSSGSATATSHWNRLVSSGQAHAGSNTPPPGALLFYATSYPSGHVALYLGNDLVATNDIKQMGRLAIVHRKELTNGLWRLRYRGWAEPSFPGAAGKAAI